MFGNNGCGSSGCLWIIIIIILIFCCGCGNSGSGCCSNNCGWGGCC